MAYNNKNPRDTQDNLNRMVEKVLPGYQNQVKALEERLTRKTNALSTAEMDASTPPALIMKLNEDISNINYQLSDLDGKVHWAEGHIQFLQRCLEKEKMDSGLTYQPFKEMEAE